MFTLTPAAEAQVAQYFTKNDIKPVRIFIANGCSGPQLALALDEARNNDAVYPCGDFEFVIEQSLMDRAQPIKIDFTGSGFKISTALELCGSCGGCGSSSSCCI
jgi:iron-sulfur cluster assembly protein